MNSRRFMTGIGFPPTRMLDYTSPATAVAQSVCRISSLPMEGSARVVALARERVKMRRTHCEQMSSGLAPIADIDGRGRHFRKVPCVDGSELARAFFT
jgi:hypothetical protein